MNEFLFLSSLNSNPIKIAIIQSLSLLILNISDTQCIYYLFSNNFINHIISSENDCDDDLVFYHVNFMKSLSQRIDLSTINFFFRDNDFPLLQSALKYYNYNDGMIINTVRNIFLTILKCIISLIIVKHQQIYDYICTLPVVSYFQFVSCRFADLIENLNKEVFGTKYEYMNDLTEDIIDNIMYFQDIFSLRIPLINYVLTNCLLYYAVLPLLAGTLCTQNIPHIMINTSIFVISLLFKHIQEENFIITLYMILFHESTTEKMLVLMKERPKNPLNYSFHWVAHKEMNKNVDYASCKKFYLFFSHFAKFF